MTVLLPPTPDGIAEAARMLGEGRLVAFPTETVYGLGVDATNDEAIERLYAAKGRPGHNPLIVHVDGIEAAWRWAASWTEDATLLALRFWPGPLTLVVPAAEALSRAALAGGDTVGLRTPDHPVARALLAAAGLPIAAPSANRSGHVSPTDAAHVLADLGGRIDAILDAGRCRRGIESTVVDLTVAPPRVLRPGPISREHLAAALGLPVEGPGGGEAVATDRVVVPVEVAVEAARGAGVEAARGGRASDPASSGRGGGVAGGGGGMGRETAPPLRSPGLLERHYAPRTPARLVEAPRLVDRPPGAVAIRLEGGATGGGDRGFDEVGPWWRLPADPAACAEALYRTLRDADAVGATEIWIARPPADDPAWEAVRDRLQRATQPPPEDGAGAGAE